MPAPEGSRADDAGAPVAAAAPPVTTAALPVATAALPVATSARADGRLGAAVASPAAPDTPCSILCSDAPGRTEASAGWWVPAAAAADADCARAAPPLEGGVGDALITGAAGGSCAWAAGGTTAAAEAPLASASLDTACGAATAAVCGGTEALRRLLLKVVWPRARHTLHRTRPQQQQLLQAERLSQRFLRRCCCPFCRMPPHHPTTLIPLSLPLIPPSLPPPCARHPAAQLVR